MNKFQASILLYGVICIVLGLLGTKASFDDHKPEYFSLIGGGALGVLSIFFGTLSKSNPRVGYIGASVVALLALGKFLPDYIKSGAIYPAGLMVVLSAALAIFLVGGHILGRRRGRTVEGAEK